jgi:low affinity Fe/Cu permease
MICINPRVRDWMGHRRFGLGGAQRRRGPWLGMPPYDKDQGARHAAEQSYAMNLDRAFSTFATGIARVTGSAPAFAVCVTVVAAWAATGPAFGYSEAWQLLINTGTTIVTFLMVFLIQNTQNRDSLALQTKLDELILTSEAENEFIGIERLTDRELQALHARCALAAVVHERLALRAKEEISTRRQIEPA